MILVLALISLPFELLNSATKPNFPNVLTTLMLLAIFTLNYFDKLYIRACIIAIAATLLLDIFWAAQLSKVPKAPFLVFLEPNGHTSLGLKKGLSPIHSCNDCHPHAGPGKLGLTQLIIAILIYRYRNNRI